MSAGYKFLSEPPAEPDGPDDFFNVYSIGQYTNWFNELFPLELEEQASRMGSRGRRWIKDWRPLPFRHFERRLQ